MYLIIILFALLLPGFEKTDLAWTDGRQLTIEGQGWEDTKSLWDDCRPRPKESSESRYGAIRSIRRGFSPLQIRFLSIAVR